MIRRYDHSNRETDFPHINPMTKDWDEFFMRPAAVHFYQVALSEFCCEYLYKYLMKECVGVLSR